MKRKICSSEFYWALDNNDYIKNNLVDLDMTPDFLRETWDILDDGDGSLTVFEFTSGIRALKGFVKTKDVRIHFSKVGNSSMHGANFVVVKQ
jgi:hypothetical protein